MSLPCVKEDEGRAEAGKLAWLTPAWGLLEVPRSEAGWSAESISCPILVSELMIRMPELRGRNGGGGM